jgi:aspartate racemase
VVRDRIVQTLGFMADTPIWHVVRAVGNGSSITAQDTVAFCLWCAAQTLNDYVAAIWRTADRLGDINTKCAIVGQVAGRWDEAGNVLAEAARSLERGGADCVVLCTNTMHKVADAITAAVGIPLIHIADATAEAIRAGGIGRVGLLGTRFTMEEAFYKGRLSERHGLAVLVPEAEDRAVVNRVIYEELCLGVVRPDSRAHYRAAMARLVERGAEGIILGCTEITLLVDASDSAVPLFDTTRLHALAAVAFALSQ